MKDSSVKRISGYGVAIAAALGVTSTEAAVHFVDINPDATGTTAPPNNGVTLLSFDLVGDVATNGTHVANEQFFFNHTYAPGLSPGFVPLGSYYPPAAPNSSKVNIGATNGISAFSTNQLSGGEIIGPGQTVDPQVTGVFVLSGFFGSPKGWAPGTRAYIGLRFDNAGNPDYGWADITTVNYSTIVLHGFAYDDQGNPIAAGSLEPIPEPSQIGLLALGAAGVAVFRRRKTLLAATK